MWSGRVPQFDLFALSLRLICVKISLCVCVKGGGGGGGGGGGSFFFFFFFVVVVRVSFFLSSSSLPSPPPLLRLFLSFFLSRFVFG